MKKQIVTLGAAAVMSLAVCTQAFAYGWQWNGTGWWYGTNSDNTTWYSNGWQWLDGNGDQLAECYYFDENGYILTGTVTPDNYTVNSNGAWTVNGVVQTKQLSVSAGWHEDSYGWKYYTGSGYVTSKWRTIGGDKYYFDDTGYMAVGFQEIDGSEYYFEESGALREKDFYYDGYYYVVDSDDGSIVDEVDWEDYTEEEQSYREPGNGTSSADNSQGTDISEEEARDKILAMESSYPEGMKWNNSNKYVTGNMTGYGCAGFAFLVQDTVFGKGGKTTKYTDFDPNNIHIGDHFRVYNGMGGEHSVIILDVFDDGVELVEGNYNSSIHWGREMSFDELESDFIYQETRY